MATHWEPTLCGPTHWGQTLKANYLGQRILDLADHSLGAYTLRAYTLGAYSLGQRILDLDDHLPAP